MCPMCVTVAALTLASATSGVGFVGLIAAYRRKLKRWLVRHLKAGFNANGRGAPGYGPISRGGPCARPTSKRLWSSRHSPMD